VTEKEEVGVIKEQMEGVSVCEVKSHSHNHRYRGWQNPRCT